MKTVYVIHAKTKKAKKWLLWNVISPDTLWVAGGIAVESRYMDDLTRYMLSAGLTKRDITIS